ncbi:MAG: biopolymer transporter ExbD [Deltaproteobacteria bacterium]|nr:biopolymer transporter ExbD [Deltaproteobacteria bacterium]
MATTRKQKKFAVQLGGRPNSDINITPLVDVVLVLLIIFMVVTPLLEKDLEVRVPSTEQVEVTADVPPDQLVVSVSKDGKLSLNSEELPAAEYENRLARALAAKKPGERLVFFLADDSSQYGALVTALDGARRAGAETLGMMTEPPSAEAAAAPAPVP